MFCFKHSRYSSTTATACLQVSPYGQVQAEIRFPFSISTNVAYRLVPWTQATIPPVEVQAIPRTWWLRW